MKIVQDEAKATALFEYFTAILGASFGHTTRINLKALGLQSADLSDLDACFSEAEVLSVIGDTPSDKAPGLDEFIGLFYKRYIKQALNKDVKQTVYIHN